jgi:general secretion pathway protein G
MTSSKVRRRGRSWLAFALGFAINPVLAVLFARTLTSWHGGFDQSIDHALAIRTTQELVFALDRYSDRHQQIPSAREGLAVLVPDYLPRLPADPWGNPFVYEPSPGSRFADVLSYGADGRSGGRGAAADVSGRFGRLGSRPPAALEALGFIAPVLIPIAAFLLSRRRPWGRQALAGCAMFWAVLLMAALGTTGPGAWAAMLPFSIALSCLVASIATLRHAPRACPFACAATIVACLTFEFLIGT